MPAFVWKGKTRDGKVVSGEKVADNKEAVHALLRRDQIMVTLVKEKGREFALPKFGGGVSSKDLAIFTRQFSVMIDAGLPLVQCLEILGTQQENKTFAKVLQQTRMDVEGGASLADAMRKQPKAFDDLFTNMIAAGEAGGILDTILKRLATYIEKNVKLKAQIKGAMVYPVSILSIAAVVIGVILWKVIPTFASMFAGMGAELPLPTRFVIGLSNWLVRLMPFLVVGTVLLVVAFKRYYATHSGRRVVDGAVLKAPIFGTVMRKSAVARFCRTLSTLISSGVPILDGLEITAKTAGNAIVEDAIMSRAQGGGERPHRLPATQGERGLPADGRPDDRRRRADGRPRRDAEQDRRLLRGGGGPGGGQPPDPDGAGDDPLPRDLRRRHHHRDVPAALRPHQQAVLMLRPACSAGRLGNDLPRRRSDPAARGSGSAPRRLGEGTFGPQGDGPRPRSARASRGRCI